MVFIIDSGAEVSLVPRSGIGESTTTTLERPISVYGFQSSGEATIITESAEMDLTLIPTTLRRSFLVCETNNGVGVIGADILRDRRMRIGLHTSTETLTIADDVYRLKKSPKEAEKELLRREKMGAEEYRREMAAGRTSWMRTKRRVTIPPLETMKVECVVESSRSPVGVFVLLSLWDSGGSDLSIPSLTYDESKERYFTPIHNHTTEPLVICRKFLVGEIKELSVDSPINGAAYEPHVEIVTLADVLAIYDGDVERDDVPTEPEIRNVWLINDKWELVTKDNSVNSTKDNSVYSTNVNRQQRKEGQDAVGYNALAALKDSLVNTPKMRTRDVKVFKRETPSGTAGLSNDLKRTPTQVMDGSDAGVPLRIGQIPPSATSAAGQTEQDESATTSAPASNDEPLRFSTICGKGKASDEELDQFYTHGMNFDLEREVTKAKVNVDSVDVDVETERKRGMTCPYWPSKDAFIKLFSLDHIDSSELVEVQDLLWDFRQCFYNDERPDQFREGIRIEPIKIPLIAAPKREKRRRMSEAKMGYCRQHVERLLREGVIERVKDTAQCFASNICVVIEERWNEFAGKNVVKSRLTLDLRQLNAALAGSSYPLPNMSDFRRKCSSEGKRIFSNLDAATYYHQIRIADESKKNFGFFALDSVFTLGRLCMGASPSVGIAQAVAERIFEKCENAFPFLDDTTTASRNTREHLDIDLPKTLATASHFNLLFRPNKAAILRTELRVLGFEISEGSEKIAPEKWDKIKNLEFPKDKKALESHLAFFNYFNPVAPRLSELCAPLRELIKKNVRFTPTERHHESFEAAKTHLLTSPAIRNVSQDLLDTVVIFTDSSRTSLSCVMAQMLRPISGDTSTPPDQRKLHLIGCWSEVLDERHLNLAIWVKELFALAKCVSDRKWSYFLQARPFFVITDSSVCVSWANLNLVSDAISRKIQHLQKFDYRVVFAESRLNASDLFSRLTPTSEGTGTYHRFLEGHLYDANGKPISWKTLYSKETCDEITTYLRGTRHQPLSRPLEENEVEREEVMELDDTILSATEDTFNVNTIATRMIQATTGAGTSLFRSSDLLGTLEAATSNQLPAPVIRRNAEPCRRRLRQQNDEETKIVNLPIFPVSSMARDQVVTGRVCRECTYCIPIYEKPGESTGVRITSTPHCKCVCERNAFLNIAADNSLATISAIELDDRQRNAEGAQVSEMEDEGIDEALDFATMKTHFSEDDCRAIHEMQRKDEDCEKIMGMIAGDTRPTKYEALLMPKSIQTFLRNRSCFALTDQGVLVRRWVEKSGKILTLLVVGAKPFVELVNAVHTQGVGSQPASQATASSPNAAGTRSTENASQLSDATTTASSPNDAGALGRQREALPRTLGMSHLGMRKTFRILSAFYYAFAGRKEVNDIISNCAVCRLNNVPRSKKETPSGTTFDLEGNRYEIDFCGPLHNFGGRPKFIFVAVDSHTRHVFATVAASTTDVEVLRCVNLLKNSIGGYPRFLQMDGAICKTNSATKALLESYGVKISHGTPGQSKHQARVERNIGTLTLLIKKLSTESPGATLQRLVDEAVLTINKSPHSALPPGISPNDLHFVRPPTGFPNLPNIIPTDGLRVAPSILQALTAARAASRLTMRLDVINYLKRQIYRSPTNHTAALRRKDLVLRKRTSFSPGSPKKFQFKVQMDGFEILAKIATNSYKIRSVLDGQIIFASGDHLIKVPNFTREDLVRLCNSFAEVADMNANDVNNPRAETRSSTRSSTRAGHHGGPSNQLPSRPRRTRTAEEIAGSPPRMRQRTRAAAAATPPAEPPSLPS